TALVNGSSVASFGAGITVNSTTVSDATHAVANITISPTSTAGTRGVNVTTAGETPDALAAGFSIRQARILVVAPATAYRGSSIDVQITAADTAFAQGISIAAFGAGVTVNATAVTDATHATASITVQTGALAGARDVTVVTGGEVADALAGGFLVLDPVIISVTPSSAAQGEALTVQVTGAGTHFAQGVSALSMGSGISVNSVTVSSPTLLTASITAAVDAAPGARDVNVITATETPMLLASGFLVRDARIVSVAPSNALAGDILDVAITGADTAFAQGVSVADFGQGVVVNSTTVADATHATASVSVQPGAGVGPRDVRMVTGAESADPLIAGFNVSDSRITGLAPSAGFRGQTLDVAVTGSGTSFTEGVSVASFSGTGITVNSTGVTDSTHSIVSISIAPGAALGARDVNVVTGAQVPVSFNGGFIVTAHAPVLSEISPGSFAAGAQVTLSGNYLGVEQGASYVSFGNMRASEYVSWTDDSIVMKVPAGAASGKVSVTNEGGTSNSLDYTVEAPTPVVSGIAPLHGGPGTVVTVTGHSFGSFKLSAGRSAQQGSVVLFNGVPAAGYTLWTDTVIKAIVPAGATPGPVIVVTASGTSDTSVKTVFAVTTPTWFLPEGTTDYGFSTRINIQNPNTTVVRARVTYMTGAGPVVKPEIQLPARSQTTVYPSADIGARDFSTKVECPDGLNISVDRTMTWTGGGALSAEAHSSVGVTAAAKVWYLAEGSSDWGFESWLLVQNPNAGPANCDVTYMIEGEGPKTVRHQVPGSSRASFNMESDVGKKDASIKVVSDVPVIPERAMYRNDRREGHDSIGTTSPAADYYLAEGTTDWGFTTYVLVQNPNNEPVDVTVTYMTSKQGAKAQPTFTMPANSRKTIRVNDVLPGNDLSTLVHGSRPIIAERAMYWDNGTGEACHDSIGMSAAHSVFYLPDGQTSEGWETWTLVQNPNGAAVTVEITYMTPTGAGNVTFTDSVPANSRKTYGMGDKLASGRAAVMVVSKTSGAKIIAERAMYFNGRGVGTDTIGGSAD
ncbi:MAG: beta strand repeat-containing protein, partial [Candidatus Geothermincolia bacterium]